MWHVFIYSIISCRLQRFEKTNEMLLNCNALSSGRLKAANDDFRKHIKLIGEMKKDLDYIFRKVRNIKARIGAQYPQAAMKAEQKVKANSLCEDGQEFDGECAMAVDAAQIASASSTSTHTRQHKPLARSIERKSSRDAVTVDYIQMDRKVDVESGIAANDTDNESSDTSDTWSPMVCQRQANTETRS